MFYHQRQAYSGLHEHAAELSEPVGTYLEHRHPGVEIPPGAGVCGVFDAGNVVSGTGHPFCPERGRPAEGTIDAVDEVNVDGDTRDGILAANFWDPIGSSVGRLDIRNDV